MSASSSTHYDFYYMLEIAKQAALASATHVEQGFYLLAEQQTRTPDEKPQNSMIEIGTKSNHADLITEYDRKSQSVITLHLRRYFPDHCILGEEDEVEQKLSDGPTWIIDPIDGTTNFVHHVDDISICIGFALNRQVKLGVVYNPITNNMYYAIEHGGAFKNGIPIHVSHCVELKKALVCTELGSIRKPEAVDRMVRCLQHLLEHGHITGIRMLGSGALDLCYVADGSMDVVYAGVGGEGWKVWDYAAASIVMKEAGAVFSGVFGEPFDLEGKGILAAANSQLHDQMVSALNVAIQ